MTRLRHKSVSKWLASPSRIGRMIAAQDRKAEAHSRRHPATAEEIERRIALYAEYVERGEPIQYVQTGDET